MSRRIATYRTMTDEELREVCEEATSEIADRVKHNLSEADIERLRTLYNEGETDFDDDMTKYGVAR